ncbi:unnamed protein product [Closterium sp. Yama58-4]|nr:unnamed protein product [Closterium sp. Yama58-4]
MCMMYPGADADADALLAGLDERTLALYRLAFKRREAVAEQSCPKKKHIESLPTPTPLPAPAPYATRRQTALEAAAAATATQTMPACVANPQSSLTFDADATEPGGVGIIRAPANVEAAVAQQATVGLQGDSAVNEVTDPTGGNITRGTRSDRGGNYLVTLNNSLRARVEDLQRTVTVLQASEQEAKEEENAMARERSALTHRINDLEATVSSGLPERALDDPVVNMDALPRDDNQKIVVKSSLKIKEFGKKALDMYVWMIIDAPVDVMQFFPTFEEVQPYLVWKYRLIGVSQDEYYYVVGGNAAYIKEAMKIIATKRSNTHKKIRFYAWGAGGLLPEDRWPELARENIHPGKRRTEAVWLVDFRHERFGYAWHATDDRRPFANVAFEKAALAAFVNVRVNSVELKIPQLAYLCVVVEMPLESYHGRGQASLAGVPATNRNAVRAKINMLVGILRDAARDYPARFKQDKPRGFELGRGQVRILIEGFENEFP